MNEVISVKRNGNIIEIDYLNHKGDLARMTTTTKNIEEDGFITFLGQTRRVHGQKT